MPWSELLGNDRAVSTLRGALADGRLPHALLFHGPEGVGKALAARLLVQTLACERSRDDGGLFPPAGGRGGPGTGPDACGSCPACRRIVSGNYPDLRTVSLEPSPSTGQLRQEIVIEQIRDLSSFLSFRPIEATRRMAIVDPADQLNAAAANAFLKTLEEPPGGALIILVSRNRFSLLETIRSRCQPVAFGRVPAASIEGLLRERGAAADDARLAAALADGAPGRALRLVFATGGPEAGPPPLAAWRERRDRVLEALRDASAGPDGPGTRVIRAAAAFEPRSSGQEFLERLELAQALLRDALVVASGAGEPVAAADVPGEMRALAEALGEERAARAVETAERIRSDLRVHVSRMLAAERLLAELAR